MATKAILAIQLVLPKFYITIDVKLNLENNSMQTAKIVQNSCSSDFTVSIIHLINTK